MNEIDHVLWASADLDVGVDSLRELTGLVAEPGGRHLGWGTRNALVGLGDAYLEVLATDPEQDGGWFADELLGLPGPRLHRWALRTSNLANTVARAEVSGLAMDPVEMSRTRPDGVELRWSIAFVEGHDFGPLVPFVIDWLDSVNPARTLEPQGRLLGVEVTHPEHGELEGVLAALGLFTEVVGGPPRLRVELDAPVGPVLLG